MSDRFCDAGAGAYHQGSGRVSSGVVPSLLRAARLAPGLRAVGIATGTGAAAEAVAAVVGPSGRAVAVDISRPMLDKALGRLGGPPNVASPRGTAKPSPSPPRASTRSCAA